MLKLERRNGPKRNQEMPGPRYWFVVVAVLALAGWYDHIRIANSESLETTALLSAWNEVREEQGVKPLIFYPPLNYGHIANLWMTPLNSQLDTTAGGKKCSNWWHGYETEAGDCMSYAAFAKQWGDVEQAQVALMHLRYKRNDERWADWAKQQVYATANRGRCYWARLLAGICTKEDAIVENVAMGEAFTIDGSVYNAGSVMLLDRGFESITVLFWLSKIPEYTAHIEDGK